MSTTVYNGCKFPEGSDFAGLLERFNTARAGALLLADKILEQQIVARALDKLDLLLIESIGVELKDVHEKPGSFENFGGILNACFQKTVERRKNPDTQHHADIDTSASVVVIPHSTGMYGICRCSNNEMRSYMRDTLGFEDYSWWNNSDAADGVSEEQWDARGKIWDDILANESIASYLGAEMFLVNKDHFVPYPYSVQTLDFSGAWPIEDRVFRAALKIYFNEEDPSNQTPGTIAGRVMDLEEGKDLAFEALRARVCKVLIQHPEPDLFKGNLKEFLDRIKSRWQADILNDLSPPASSSRSGLRM